MVDVDEVSPAIQTTAPKGLVGRVYLALGYLHPATVHFPIAFFLLGGLFVVIGIRFPLLGTQIPLACLWLGTLSSIAAGAMGWSFSVSQGYGGWDRFGEAAMDTEVFWHRWSAVIVTAIAIVSSVLAIRWVRANPNPRNDSKSDDLKSNKSQVDDANVVVDGPSPMKWKIGLLLCAAIVGAVGHQGGEMTYGEDFYPKMFRTLTGETESDSLVNQSSDVGVAAADDEGAAK